jgi:hypothetical protein
MKVCFLVFVALVIPLFFAFIFLMSAYSRLATLRKRCQEALSELQSAHDEADRETVRKKYAAAIAAFESARSAFPGPLIVTLFRIAPVESPPATDARERPTSATNGNTAN